MENTTHTTVTIDSADARKLVALIFDQDEKGRYGGKYWQLDEALTVALVEIAANDLGR